MINYEGKNKGILKNAAGTGNLIAGVGQAIGGVLSGLNINTGGRKTGQANQLLAASQAAAISNQQKLEAVKTLSEIKKGSQSKNTLIIIAGITILVIFVIISFKK